MKVGIEFRETAYLPEALAYKKYLENKGYTVQFARSKNLDKNNDINLLFPGFIPFWKKTHSSAKVIHEYSSLSTGIFPKTKDVIKRLFNKKPDGRIFPSNIVREKSLFKKQQDNIPYLIRDFGVDSEFFGKTARKIQYDIIYCGSIAGRPGLIRKLNHLCEQGFSLIVIGKIEQNDKSKLTKNKNMTITGQLERSTIKRFYEESRFGLNYTPDIYPFNIQTSMKTLEYLAAGLPVISNKYQWIAEFSQKNSDATIIWLDEVTYPLPETLPSRLSQEYSWDSILEKSGFEDFLKSISSKKSYANTLAYEKS